MVGCQALAATTVAEARRGAASALQQELMYPHKLKRSTRYFFFSFFSFLFFSSSLFDPQPNILGNPWSQAFVSSPPRVFRLRF